MDSKTADPNNFDSQGKPLKALARLSVTASSDLVRALARKVFGANAVIEPASGVLFCQNEPVMYVSTRAPYTQQQLTYFCKILDSDTNKYKVSYAMPDKDYSPNTIKVCFFKGYTPTR
jgi:hypothetical protein